MKWSHFILGLWEKRTKGRKKSVQRKDELRERIRRVREELGANPEMAEWNRAIGDFLPFVETDLAQDKPDLYQLGRHAFGIFRVVTDNYSFEKSPIGRELLDISTELSKLSNE